jgi:hypothetical protein
MEYMQRIAEQISESIRRTIQLEAEQQQRIQAMWNDIQTFNHHYGMKTHMVKSEAWRDKVFEDFGFRQKHDPAFDKTGQPMDEDLELVNEMAEILKDYTPEPDYKSSGVRMQTGP